jgi:hypothetical protein
MSCMMSFVRQFRNKDHFLLYWEVRVFITECFWAVKKSTLSERHWVLNSEFLCTKLIQYTHDSTMTEHLKEIMMFSYITILLIRNVTEHLYILLKLWQVHMNNSWKDCWQGFLKPLPVWREFDRKIFIDFVVDLLSSEGCMNLLITDCLSKKVILKLCKDMTAEWVTQTFIQHFYQLMSFYHNSLRLRHSVCEQSMKESLSTFEDCTKNVHSISLKKTEHESECWAVHLYVLQL